MGNFDLHVYLTCIFCCHTIAVLLMDKYDGHLSSSSVFMYIRYPHTIHIYQIPSRHPSILYSLITSMYTRFPLHIHVYQIPSRHPCISDTITSYMHIRFSRVINVYQIPSLIYVNQIPSRHPCISDSLTTSMYIRFHHAIHVYQILSQHPCISDSMHIRFPASLMYYIRCPHVIYVLVHGLISYFRSRGIFLKSKRLLYACWGEKHVCLQPWNRGRHQLWRNQYDTFQKLNLRKIHHYCKHWNFRYRFYTVYISVKKVDFA